MGCGAQHSSHRCMGNIKCYIAHSHHNRKDRGAIAPHEKLIVFKGYWVMSIMDRERSCCSLKQIFMRENTHRQLYPVRGDHYTHTGQLLATYRWVTGSSLGCPPQNQPSQWFLFVLYWHILGYGKRLKLAEMSLNSCHRRKISLSKYMIS